MPPPRHRIEHHVQYLEGEWQLQAFQVIRNVCGMFEKPSGQPWGKMCYFHHPVHVRLPSGMVRVLGHTAVFFPPNAYQLYGDDRSRWDHVWWLLGGPMYRELMGLSKVPLLAPIAMEGPQAVDRLVSGLVDELSVASKPEGKLVHCLLLEFLHRVGRAASQGPASTLVPDSAAHIKAWLDRRYRSPLRLPAIAGAHHMSVPNLCLVFKKAFGMTVGDYIIHRRMEQARALLSEPDLSIREVASTCGYEDAYYFSRLFRRRVGVSPLRYRNGFTLR